ncbi:MAG: FkbM family methyltransferase [Thermodesulfovibrionales bacterium]
MTLLKRYIKNLLLNVLPDGLLLTIKKIYYTRSLISFNEADVHVIKLLITSGDCVIDIGANIGWYTKILSELVGSKGRVFSIEPIPSTFNLLAYFVNKFKLNNVHLSNFSISDKDGEVLMEIPMYESGGKNYYQAKIVKENQNNNNFMDKFIIQAKSLDSFFSRSPNKIDFIKCDVEGHELSVVRGAVKLIAKSKPAWLIEINSNPDLEGTDSFILFNIMKKYGYKAFYFDGNKLEERLKNNTSINYFFLGQNHIHIIENAGLIVHSLN